MLPNYKTVVSDQWHTPDGKNFWGTLIAKSITDNKAKVYFVNTLAPNRKAIEITDTDDIPKLSAWGSEQKYQARRLILTTDPLDTTQ